MAAEKKHKKAKPTAADKAAAKVIKKKLYAMGDRRPTQDELVSEWAKFGGRGSQSAMSQYINGDIPHNLRSVMFFARILKCDPREIYPSLPGLENYVAPSRDEVRDAPIAQEIFEPHEAAILKKLLQLPPDLRNGLIAVILSAYEIYQSHQSLKRRTKQAA